MKKYVLVFVAFVFASCEGPMGPSGPPGPPGPQGPPGLIGQAFRVEADFGPNNYQQIFAFPQDIVVYKSDIVMVYLLWTVDEQTGYNVWQPLPVSVFFQDGGELQYAFDHTVADVRLFLTGDIALNTLGPDFTQNQRFKVVILPADYVLENNVNLKDMDAVMNLVDKSEIQSFKAKDLK